MMSNKRRSVLLFLLLICIAFFIWQKGYLDQQSEPPLSNNIKKQISDKSKNLALSNEIKADIRHYFAGVSVTAKENSLKYAIQLDHGAGRKALASGNKKKAYEVYKKVLAISYQQGSLMGIGIGLGSLSNIIYEMDDVTEALKLTFLEYQVSKVMDKRFEYGLTEMRLATLLSKRDRGMSMGWQLRAKESLAGTPYKQDYVSLLNNLVNNLSWYSKDEHALKVAAEAWLLSKNLGNKPSYFRIKTSITETYAYLLMNKHQQYQQALTVINEILPSFSIAQKKHLHYFRLLHLKAICYQHLNELKRANQFFASAYSYYEQVRQNALGDQDRAKLDQDNLELVNHFIDALIADNKLYMALSVLETNKARTLSDISQDSQQKSIYQQWTKLQLKHSQQRVDYFEDSTETQALPSLEQDVESIVETVKMDDSWTDYAQLLDKQTKERQTLKMALKIRRVATSESMSSEQVKNLQQEMNNETAIISLYLNQEKLFVFLLTKASLQFVETEFTASEGILLVKRLQAALTNPLFDFYKRPSQVLYKQLFNPIKKHLNNDINHLIYSPDNLFSSVPLSVLFSEKGFLNDQYAITRVPSLRYAHINKNHTHPIHGISCVDPEIKGARLPFQQQTGKKLEQLFSGRLKSLKAADCSIVSLEKTIAENKDNAFLHIGAHGLFYPRQAMASGIYLTDNNTEKQAVLWDAKAIGAINLDHFNLITLASCETGLSDINYSRDVFGILRTLFFSGAQSVIAPLWKVQDIATSELMQQFYKHYANNIPMHKALRLAKKSLMDSQQYSHPYYWSGLVLTGGIK